LAFCRSKSKETSAFPKPYPLRNRAIGDEMASMLKKAPSQLAEAVGARMSGIQNQFSFAHAVSINRGRQKAIS
jgi:hypothetical protein